MSTVIAEREALDRHRLQDRINRYAFGDLTAPDAVVRVVEGNLRIEGDLELHEHEYAGIIVEGDLEVTGSIINARYLPCCRRPQDEGIPFLLVAGNLRAANVAVGSSQVSVEGNAHVEHLLLLHDIDTRFRVAGTSRVGLLVDTFNAQPGFPLSDHLHADVPIERDEENGVAVERVEAEVLIARLRAGLPVLRAADDPRPRKSYAQWLADCATYGDVLRHVPRDLIDEAMSFAAVRSYGHAIEQVPRELVTDGMVDAALAENPWALQSVPVEFRTAERCRAAVQHQGRMLAHVPMELRTTELCALAIARDARQFEVMPSIPKEAFTPELALLAVRRDGSSLEDVPEELRTFDVCVAAVQESLMAAEHVPEAIREEVTRKVLGR